MAAAARLAAGAAARDRGAACGARHPRLDSLCDDRRRQRHSTALGWAGPATRSLGSHLLQAGRWWGAVCSVVGAVGPPVRLAGETEAGVGERQRQAAPGAAGEHGCEGWMVPDRCRSGLVTAGAQVSSRAPQARHSHTAVEAYASPVTSATPSPLSGARPTPPEPHRAASWPTTLPAAHAPWQPPPSDRVSPCCASPRTTSRTSRPRAHRRPRRAFSAGLRAPASVARRWWPRKSSSSRTRWVAPRGSGRRRAHGGGGIGRSATTQHAACLLPFATGRHPQ